MTPHAPPLGRAAEPHPDQLAPGPERDQAVLRLLEEGSSTALRRLFATVGEAEVATVAARRGPRQLSRRSRRFWRAVLGVPLAEPPAIARRLWPLA